MSKITYADKEFIYENAEIPEINKTTDGNMNEIKTVVNENDTRLTTAEGEIDTAQTDVDNLQTGWNSAGETWTYSSVDDPTGVITISGNKTGKYSLGMRIKFTNGGNIIYGIITKISYSSPNTTLTFLHEINPSTSTALHLMANSAITNNYYSNMKAPYGFPLNKDKWSILASTSSNLFRTPTNSVWWSPGLSISIPIGQWDTFYRVTMRSAATSATFIVSSATLSTTTNSDTNNIFTTGATQTFTSGVISALQFPHFVKNQLTISSKTTFYLLHRITTNGTITELNGIAGAYDDIGAYIKITCAYL